jgi:hypothetical protein
MEFLLCNFVQPPDTSPLSGPNSLIATCSSLNVRDQVLHPYKTTDKIISLYILIDYYCMVAGIP